MQTRRAFNLSFCIWWAPQALSISIGCAVFMIEVPKKHSQPNWYCTRWCHFPLLQLGWRCYVLDQNLIHLKPTMFTSLHVGPPCMLDFCRFLLQLEIRFHNFGHCRHTTIESTNIFPLFWTWSPNTKEVTVIIYDLFTMQNHALNKTHTHTYIYIYIHIDIMYTDKNQNMIVGCSWNPGVFISMALYWHPVVGNLYIITYFP